MSTEEQLKTQDSEEIIDIEPQVIEDTLSAQKSGSKGSALKIAGLVVAVGAVCAVGGGWMYRDMLSSYFPSDQLQAVEAKVAALEAASKDSQKRADAFVALTEELKAQLGAAQSAAEKSAKQNADTAALSQNNAQAITDLKQALDAARKTVEDIKAQATTNTAAAGAGNAISDAALTARVAQLETEVAALKSVPAKTAGIDMAAVQQAFAALKAKAYAGVPYATEFSALQNLLPAAAGMDVIGAESGTGAPTAQQLATELSTIAVTLPKPVAASAPDTSWWGTATSALSNLVSVKTVGESDASVIAAQALTALQAGDAQKAAAALSSAPEPLPDALKAWNEKLQKRVKFDQALTALADALSHLPASKG